MTKIDEARPAASSWTTAAEILRGLGARQKSLLLSGLRQHLEHRNLHVIVFGEFSRGKSTLINAILGQPVLDARLIPTTGHVTRVVYGPKEEVRVRYVDGRVEHHGLDQFSAFSTLDGKSVARDDVEALRIAFPCPLLEAGLVITDTPGVGEQKAQTRRAKGAIAYGDLVLLMLDARQMLGSAEHELAAGWLSTELNKPVLPVLNFMNLVEPAERNELRDRLQRWCSAHLRVPQTRILRGTDKPWFEINALAALKRAVGQDVETQEDFDRLLDVLSSCQGSKRRALQGHSRISQLRHHVAQTRAWNDELLAQLRADAEAVEQNRLNAREVLKTAQRRIEACAPVEFERSRTIAELTFQKHLDSLKAQYKGYKSNSIAKSMLSDKADTIFNEKFSTAIRAVEKSAYAGLLDLACDDVGRPEPLAIKEEIGLDDRLDVGRLLAKQNSTQEPTSDAGAIGGAAIGAAIGTAIFPIIGTAVGAFFGAAFGSGASEAAAEPDYAAIYCEEAEKRWKSRVSKVQFLLKRECEKRIGDINAEIEQRLQELRPQPAGEELANREKLAHVLNECLRQLPPDRRQQ